MTFVCKTETLGSLYIHVPLISNKSSKSEGQVVHELKFKDPLRSTCQVSSERRVLDLELEVIGSIHTEGNILSLEFFLFLSSNASDTNNSITANFVCL